MSNDQKSILASSAEQGKNDELVGALERTETSGNAAANGNGHDLGAAARSASSADSRQEDATGAAAGNASKVSRRAILATLGGAGAAVAAQSLLGAYPSYGESILGTVYGNGNHPKLPDLRELDFVLASSFGELRAMSQPAANYLYLVTDLGAESLFRVDPTDAVSPDDGVAVIVAADGTRLKRLGGPLFAQPGSAFVSVHDFHASGSAFHTTGSIAAGSTELTVQAAGDFAVGHGILIAGAGAPLREVLTVVVDSDAAASGTIALQLPGEAAQTVAVSASYETIQLTFTDGCTTSGHIALVLDTVEHRFPVTAGQTAEQIASRLRGSFHEDWTASGTGASVQLVARTLGRKRDSYIYAQGTGVAATLAMTKGSRTTARGAANTLRSRTFANWDTGGYNNSNVVFFIAKTTGPKSGHAATIDNGATGMGARLETAQYGDYLLAEVTAVSGNTITISHPALQHASSVYVGHDDSAALQAALAQSSGKTLWLPAGIYLSAKGLEPPAGATLLGDGCTQTTIQLQALKQRGIRIRNGRHDVQIRHLKLKNVCGPNQYDNGNDTEMHGIAIEQAYRTTVEHCWIDNTDDAGIRVGYSSEGNSAWTRLFSNIVTNTAEGSGIEIIRGESCFAAGNIVRMSAQHGIRLCGSRRPIVIGNTIENNSNGISIQGFGSGGHVTQRTSDFVVEGNVVQNVLNQGINVYNRANSGVIKGNWLESGNSQKGIRFTTVVNSGKVDYNYGILCEGNMVKGFSIGIELFGDMETITIRGNTIKDFYANDSANGYAILLDCGSVGSLRHIVLEGNTIVCHSADHNGIHLLRPADGTSVYANHNSCFMRLTATNKADIVKACMFQEAGGTYAAGALQHWLEGTFTVPLPGGETASGTTVHDTNRYVKLPV